MSSIEQRRPVLTREGARSPRRCDMVAEGLRAYRRAARTVVPIPGSQAAKEGRASHCRDRPGQAVGINDRS
jgi:hypothetical protein